METKYVVGKRYKWNPYTNGVEKWKNGICSRIDNESGYVYFVTRDNEEWEIPLECNGVEPYK